MAIFSRIAIDRLSAKRILMKEGDLQSGDRRRGVVRARRLFCQLVVRGMGYSGAEVGRYLGATTSAVNRLAVSEELPDLKQYLKLF
jgi:hypothetical protein